MPGKPFPALEGVYQFLYLYFEPISTFIPAFMATILPGAVWFHNELIPGSQVSSSLEARSIMAVWQLANCYALIGMLSSFVFRAVRDSLPNNPAAQERIIGASLTALAIADVTHVIFTLLALPPHLRMSPLSWNPLTIGNIPIVIFLFMGRLCWFAGIGRKTYYYSLKQSPLKKE